MQGTGQFLLLHMPQLVTFDMLVEREAALAAAGAQTAALLKGVGVISHMPLPSSGLGPPWQAMLVSQLSLQAYRQVASDWKATGLFSSYG